MVPRLMADVTVELARAALHTHAIGTGIATRYRLQRVDSVLRLPDIRWIVDEWFCHGGYSVVYGPPGIGKTAVLLHLAVAVASGRPWMGRSVEQTGVLYVAAEGLAGFKERLEATLDAFEIPHMRRSRLPLRVIDDAPDLTQAECIAGIVHAAARVAGGCGLVIIDPLVECMSGDENGEGMQIASAGAGFIARRAGAAVVIGHHTDGKGVAERGNKRLRARALGMVKTGRAGDARTLSVDKQRHGREYELQFVLGELVDSVVPLLVPGSERIRGAHPRIGSPSPHPTMPTAEALLRECLLRMAPCSTSALIRAAEGRGRGDEVLRNTLRRLIEEGHVLRHSNGRMHVLSLKDLG